ncbi:MULTISPECIES: CRISPR-associated protein Cas5 [unclassified Halobacteriovorax]
MLLVFEFPYASFRQPLEFFQ